MRSILSILFLFCTFICLSQVTERQILKGKINVPQDSDVANISVYNINTEKGTNTNSNGEFLIKVKTTDHLLISSVQFENFEIEITKEIMEERDIVINIRENINQLNPVTVSSNVLTGDLDVDIKKITTNSTQLNIDQNELINGYDASITIDSQIRANNVAVDNDYLDYPMDFIQIFKRYIQKKDKSKNNRKQNLNENIDIEVRKMYDNEFFRENFNIKEEDINAFIFHAYDNGFNEKLLNKGNEMDLIEFLLNKAEKFNEKKLD